MVSMLICHESCLESTNNVAEEGDEADKRGLVSRLHR